MPLPQLLAVILSLALSTVAIVVATQSRKYRVIAEQAAERAEAAARQCKALRDH
ncbi:hypothetical protein AB0B07_33060 [Streptomyces sioyaensis]|uniref:hypothetical protein n=1 Tax=Streptomyces sioyaensis TaxID=67364 RepID=UPI0033C6D28E